MALSIGDVAPSFEVNIDGSGKFSLSEAKGSPVVLYFYPKDDTPGCTKEACGFRDAFPDFSALNAAIVGVSKDTVTKHDKFKAKYELPFHLASDEDGSLCEAYGTWVEKSMYGKKYMGAERSTFLIDDNLTVKYIWRKVKVEGHVNEVFDKYQELIRDL